MLRTLYFIVHNGLLFVIGLHPIIAPGNHEKILTCKSVQWVNSRGAFVDKIAKAFGG